MTAEDRVRRQRETFRPFVLLVLVAVLLTTHLRLDLVPPLAVFAAALVLAYVSSVDVLAVVAAAAAAIALGALEPSTAPPAIVGATAVWLAIVRLPLRIGVAVAGTSTLGLAAALAAAGDPRAIVSAVLSCALLGMAAYFVRTTRAGERRLETLLGELEAAREAQLASAADAERTRIARELHDVLAHALSGAAIQLQGARRLAEREHANEDLRAAIERASELVRDGLANARDAVEALRQSAPGVDQLPALVAGRAALTVEGAPRPLPAEVGLTLYRAAQEALTNASRYAGGAAVAVTLRYEDAAVRMEIENGRGHAPLAGVGGGRGLTGLGERVEQAGGTMHAGPTDDGWLVAVEVPA
jgi:signal transduction histidine kinase